jgi:PAS domain S-box-containing protein
VEQTGPFEKIFEHSIDGILLTRPDGTVLRANPAACRALLRSEAEICRAGRQGLVVEDERVRELLARRAAGEAVSGELTFRRSDRTTFPVEFTSGHIPTEAGPPLSYVIFRDVSERRRLEEELSRSAAMLKGITDTIPEAIFLKDRDGRWTFANPATLEVVGKSLDQVLGKTDLEIHADRRVAEALAETDRRIMETGVAEEVEEVVQSRDGYRVYLSSKAPFRDHDGRVIGLVGGARDITDRTRAADALREREYLLSESQRIAHVGTWSSDLSTGVIHWSDEVYRILDRSRALDPAPTSLLQVIHPDDRPRMEDWGRRCAAGERPGELQFRVERPDGSVRVLVGRGELIAATDRAPARMIGTIQDVTEHHRAEQALRESEERLRTVFAATPDAVAILGPDGGVLEANAAAMERYGYTRAELLGRTPEDLSPVELRGQVPARIQEALERRLPFEWRVVRKDGTELPVEITLRPFAMRGQSCLYASVRDIGERKRAEAERERLTMAIEQAAEMVVVTDAEGNIVYVNPAFEAVTGYARAEVLGRNPRILKSGVQDEAFYGALWAAIAAGQTWHGRLINRKKDGTHYTEDATISPVRDATGAIASYVAVKRDISRDLALEAQLLQAQKMESIGRLAGGVAHDFNNLLSVILGCTAYALASVRDGDRLRDDLLEIEMAGQRAAALTRQLLAFSRKQVLQPVELDLNRVLAEMEKMLHRIIGEDIDLVKLLGPDLWQVKADPGQIEQVIMNLVVNARDAMPEGGKVTIETANVDLDAEYAAGHAGAVPGPHVMIAVTDSGTGMDEPTMARAFEPFFTTKEAGKGSGLGLSTVYGIVKQSGGSIYVYSELGKGTTFKVYLPRGRSTTPSAEAPPAKARVGGAETILVVEDDEAVRNIAGRILGSAGYQVLAAASGPEALRISEAHAAQIHLVLTDVVMPEMNGKVFIDRLARVRTGFKILFMSGYTDNFIVHQGMLDARTHLIGKPLTRVELLRKVREVLDNRG